MGGRKARLPVAISSLSYGVTEPSSPVMFRARRIHIDDAHAQAQADAVLLIPFERIDRDVLGGPLARQHRREQDAVVVDVRLVAEDRDFGTSA